MSNVRETVLAVQRDLNACLLERESAIENALLALLTGEHYLQLGPAGVGKSMLVRALSKRLTGGVYYEKLLTAFSVPEELFGPIDLLGYADRGEYRRVSRGSASEAHFIFLDEIWKANSAILNSLLTLMNERLLHEVGFAPQRVPLLSLFGASNETPSESSLRALDDRFLLRQEIRPLSDDASFAQLITAPLDIDDIQATLTLEELRHAQAEVKQVKGTPEVLQALLALRQGLSEEGIVVSDRRWRQSGRLLKANAWLQGHAELDAEHLLCLEHAIWTDPAERKTAQRKVYEVACPLALRAIEIEDQMQETFDRIPAKSDGGYHQRAENALQILTDGHRQLSEEIQRSLSRDMTQAERSLAKIASLHQAASTALFHAIKGLTLR